MNMKHLQTYITLFLACFLLACQQDDTVKFSYSPETPRAGENVLFSNQTKEGEEWKWTFGDGGESTLNSPKKVYSEAGTYTVTLQVDGKKYRTYTKTITVRDTVPTIVCSVDTLAYYQTATFRADFYNPNVEGVSYLWTLPESAVVVSGDSTSSTVRAYFTTKDTEITVSLLLTIGTTTHTLTHTYRVNDAPATALLFATREGELLRQRMYANGAETPAALAIEKEQTADTKALLIDGNNLYILANGIFAFDLNTHKIQVLNNEARAVAGYIDSDLYKLYWADATTIHDLHVVVNTDKVLASTTELTDFPHTEITDLARYTSLYLVAGDKGIYRFRESDINSGTAPATATILGEYAITDLAVDAIARKLYFIANKALYVSNVDGAYPTKLATNAAALSIDNASNRVYFATAEGVAYLPLVQTPNNTTTTQSVLINETKNVVAIAVDPIAR